MKTAMILASLAAMAISGNALALNANVPGAARNAHVGGEDSGQLVFVPLATISKAPSADFPYGACQYTSTWSYPSAAAPAVIGLCKIREAKNASHLACQLNRNADFGTFASADKVTCQGIDPSGALWQVSMALSESASGLNGAVVFDGLGTDFIEF